MVDLFQVGDPLVELVEEVLQVPTHIMPDYFVETGAETIRPRCARRIHGTDSVVGFLEGERRHQRGG
jgi:hypothetical protein